MLKVTMNVSKGETKAILTDILKKLKRQRY